jgi:phosphoglycerol transferase
VLALVAALGVFDETSVGYVPDYPRAEAAYRSDADFVARIEASLPAGAMVFQLPYLPFYESPPLHRMQDYEPARFYLHSRELRWSYGAMKGREAAAWQEGVVRRPLPRALERVVLAGFAGLTVDRFGYADGGRETEKQIDAVAGPHAFTSADGRFVLYDLRPLADRLRQSLGEERSAESRAKALEPVAARAR